MDMGFIRLPLSFSLLVVVLLAIWSTAQLLRGEPAADQSTKAWIDAILFWGLFAGVTGVLGTLAGIIVGARAIEAAGEVSSALAWVGVQVALLSSVFGGLILGLAALRWFALQLSWRLLAAESEAHAQAGFVG
jgi:hypothetical protein